MINQIDILPPSYRCGVPHCYLGAVTAIEHTRVLGCIIDCGHEPGLVRSHVGRCTEALKETQVSIVLM